MISYGRYFKVDLGFLDMKKNSSTRMNPDEHGLDLISEVRKKKEFSALPDSVVVRALEKSGDDVKEARKFLRKYFGVFLTNKVLKGKGYLLEAHMSSKKRDYQKFYGEIFGAIGNRQSDIKSVVDLGCGVNGFSYEFLPGSPRYVGIEAAGQLVRQMNEFFEAKGFDAEAVCGDLFDLDFVVKTLEKAEKDRVVFLFQVVDALESVERNFSLKLVDKIMENCEWLVLSVPLVSLGGGKKFAVKRKWLMDYLEDGFDIVRDFEMFGERVLIVRKG